MTNSKSAQTNSDQSHRSRWTAEEKLSLITAAESLSKPQLEAFLHSHGLTQPQLEGWRTAALSALQDSQPPDSGAEASDSGLDSVVLHGLATASVVTGASIHEMGNLTANLDFGLYSVKEGISAASFPGQDKVFQSLDHLSDTALRLRELIASIMDVTRVDDHRPCKLREAVERATNLFRLALRNKSIEIRTSVVEQIIVDVPFYVAALAIANLLSNSIAAIGEKGSILIEAEDAGHEVKCAVTDSGPGIPASIRDNLFKLGITTKDNSHGLGLYLARRSLMDNQGHLELTNPTPGNTQFTIRMPKPESNLS